MARASTQGQFLPRTPMALALALLVATLYFAREVIIPIALAVLLTFLLTPLVRRLERIKVRRGMAVVVAMFVAILGVGAMGWIVERQMSGVMERLPEYRGEIARKIDTLGVKEGSLLSRVGAMFKDGRHAKAAMELTTGAVGPDGLPVKETAPASVPVTIAPIPIVEGESGPLTVAAALAPVIKPLTTTVLVLVFTIFMLLKREDIRSRFLRLVGEQEMHAATPAIDDAAGRVSRYLLIQVCINGALGVIIGAGLMVIGVPNAALWGLLIAILRFVPYVGVWIATGLIGFVSLASGPGFTQPLLAVGLILVVEMVVSNFIEPTIIGAGTGLSPLAILTAVVFWLWLWGPIGLLLAVPLTVCLVVVGRNVPRLGFLEVLLGDAPALSLQARVYQRLLAGDPEEAGQIVDGFAKEHPVAEVFDGLLMPALRMAETDRQRGVLDAERENGIGEMVGVMVEDLGGRASAAAPEGTTPASPIAGLVLCVPVRDIADELAARMLQQMLAADGCDARVFMAASMTGEMVEEISRLMEKAGGGAGGGAPAAVCISAVPPGETVQLRVLCKRLRKRFPQMAIVVGLWEGAEGDRAAAKARLEPLCADHIVMTLSEAVSQMRNLGTPVACAVEPGKSGAVVAVTAEGKGAGGNGAAVNGNGKAGGKRVEEEVELEAAED